MNILISYADSIVNGHFLNRIKDAGHASSDCPKLDFIIQSKKPVHLRRKVSFTARLQSDTISSSKITADQSSKI